MPADVVLMSVPLLELRAPVTGPYLLKSQLQNNGISCKVYDFNCYLWYELGGEYPELWDKAGSVFGFEKQLEKYRDIIGPVVTEYVKNIMEEDNPNWIGITQFAWTSGWISKWIFQEFKDQGFVGKTILGGPNCMEYDQDHHMWGVADHVIYGEGEDAIVALIKNQLNFPGIDNKQFRQLQNLDIYPYPDYSDIELHKYPYYFEELDEPKAWRNEKDGLRHLYITSSRGCVRNCTFCDIHAMAPKYKWRSGQCVAEEAKHHYQQLGIKRFLFTDSLINGATKVFEDFLRAVVQYKEEGLLPEDVVFWGQAIARPARQMNEEHFSLMDQAGVRSIAIGVESGSEAVRDHMGKKFSNDDLDYTFDMCQKYNVDINVMMLVGYPTETEEDFQDTLEMFSRHSDKAKNTLRTVSIGPTLGILPHAPLAHMAEELNINNDVNGDWQFDENTMETRLDRWLRLREHLIGLNYKVFPDRHSKMITEYKERLEQVRKGERTPNKTSYIESWGYDNVTKTSKSSDT